ncbi:MAG: DNA polymerase I [Spirochaetaceae bacterium]|jgi:DNA polymerase-1|nr:DNA polymerase I [Spirochaetaceae bacterium]
MSSPLFLLDSYALIYRAYFAFISKPLRNRAGENVSALFGFSRIVNSLISDGRPKIVAAVMDSRGPTFRHKEYPEYKATRQKTPEDLRSQVPLVETFLKSLGAPVLQSEGCEADDVIAALALRCRAENRECYIVSGDKDLLQLVGNGVYELRPLKRPSAVSGGEVPAQNGASEREWLSLKKSPLAGFEVIDEEDVIKEWGVPPSKILDFLALTGDSSDNVPGVKGIGEKTALKLITRFGSLENIYSNIAGIEGAAGKKLCAGEKDAFLSKKLISLKTDIVFDFDGIDSLKPPEYNYAKAVEFLLGQEIRSVARDIARLDASLKTPEAGKNEEPPNENGLDAESEEPATDIPKTDAVYRCITELGELDDFCKRAKKQGFFALDFETDSLDTSAAQVVGFSLALKSKEGFYVPVMAHGPDADSAFLPSEEARSRIAGLLSDPNITVIAHNAKFDYKISRTWGLPHWKAKIFDTMIAAWIIDPDFASYSLEKVSYFYLDYKDAIHYKDIVPKGMPFNVVPLELACRYSAEDADVCVRLREFFLNGDYFSVDAAKVFFDLEMPLLPILAEMEIAGIKINKEELKKYGEDLTKELSSIQFEAWEMVGREFNLASPKQLQDILFVERGLRPTKKTPTGLSTDMSVLEELASEDELCAKILSYRTASKLKSTYVDSLCNLADENGRLHTTFFQTGTATGRLSSRDPNLQNIPVRETEGRRIREAFIAEEGKLLISADYNQIELVVLAHLSGDKNLCEAFNNGEDVHSQTAALIFGVPVEDVTGSQRRAAKTINFGVMYGMSSYRLSKNLKISAEEASRFIKAYFKTYSGVKEFIENVIADAEKNGFVTTMFGRRRAIKLINSKNKVEKAGANRMAVNTPIQGGAADIVKRAMLTLDAELQARNLGAKILLQVHDELILEAPEEIVEETAAVVRSVMENAVKLSPPLRVSLEIGKNWGEFH